MAIVNNRVLHAQHRGIIAASDVINSVDAGGLMVAAIDCGFDDIITAGADGFSMPEVDRLSQYVRGTVTTQDWTEVLNILAGTVDEYHYFERNSGAATFRRNEFRKPYVFAADFTLVHRGRSSSTFSFECAASDVDIGVSDLWVTSDAILLTSIPKAITYSPGLEIETAVHNAAIYHTLGFTLSVAGQLVRASGDSDVGYTAVDIVWGGVPISGTLTIQDSDRMLTLLTSAEQDLVLTVRQAQGAASKTLTVKDVLFTSLAGTSNAGSGYTAYTLNWVLNSAQASLWGYDTDKPFAGDLPGVAIA